MGCPFPARVHAQDEGDTNAETPSVEVDMEPTQEGLDSESRSKPREEADEEPVKEDLQTEPRPDRPREPEDLVEEEEGQVAGFDKGAFNGFFVQSRDGRFRLTLGAYTEFRYTGNVRQIPEGDQDKYEGAFTIPRTRLFFDGLFGPGIGFHLQLDLSDEGNFTVIDAHGDLYLGELVRRQRTKGFWFLRVGRFFRAVSRENWMFPVDLLGIDYTGVETVMGVGNGDGAQVFFALDRYRTWFAVTGDALGEVSNFASGETSVSVSTRSEVQVGKSDWSNWSDNVGRRGRPFGVLFGVATAYQYSQAAVDFDNAQHSGTVTADVSFSGNGFQTLTYGTVNWARVNGRLEYIRGVVAQGGYFINKIWQLYVEYDHLSPGNRESFTSYNALSIGTNVFPFEWTNKYRVSVEGGMLFNAINTTLVPPIATLGWLPAASGNQYRIRTQFVFGF